MGPSPHSSGPPEPPERPSQVAWTPPNAGALPPTFCRACGSPIDSRASICPKCGVAQHAVNLSVLSTQEPKSVGLAIFLSFIWPGVGHLYSGSQTEKGIVFTCISGLLFLISLTIFGLILTIPAWFGMAIYTMIDSNKIVKAQNQQLALTP